MRTFHVSHRIHRRLVTMLHWLHNYLVEGRDKSSFARYATATLWVLLAFSVRRSLGDELGERVPFSFFLMASMIAAWCGGSGPGIAALVSGLLLGDWFFLPPPHILFQYRTVEWALVLGYLLPGGVAIGLFETLHAIRRRLRREKVRLAEEVERRMAAERELEAARAEVTHYAEDLERAVQHRTADLNGAVQFLERFCSSIAHDLRAPLRAMTSFSSLLMVGEEIRLSAQSRELAERIVKASKRMDQLVTDLLEYGRLSHVNLRCEVCDVHVVASAVTGALDDWSREKNARVVVEKELPPVRADSNLLFHVLLQLFKNAVEFSRPGVAPEVVLSGEQCGEWTIFRVKDNGVGIPPEYAQKVFGVFQTLDVDEEHTGIGLAMVAKAMERMGGLVELESQPGQGSTVVLRFPSTPRAEPRLQRPERAMRSKAVVPSLATP